MVEAIYVNAAAVRTFLAPFNSSWSRIPVFLRIAKPLLDAFISTGKVTN